MGAIDSSMEPMLEMFVFETTTLLEQLDQIILDAEKLKKFSIENINEIFRIMHTIKGSSAMMGLEEIATMSHHVEDMFYIIRENNKAMDQHGDAVFDLTLECSDYLKQEMETVQDSNYESQSSADLTKKLQDQILLLKEDSMAKEPVSSTKTTKTAKKSTTKSSKKTASKSESGIKLAKQPKVEDATKQADLISIKIFYEEDCQMENVRAFMLITQLKEVCDFVDSLPENPQLDASKSQEIIQNGLLLFVRPSHALEEVIDMLDHAPNIKSYEFVEKKEEVVQTSDMLNMADNSSNEANANIEEHNYSMETQTVTRGKQNLISVNQLKLDQLMDIVGEIVIAQSMVASNPDLKGLQLDNFSKSIRELRKLTDELQDITMSIRMVPMSTLFHKMNRIIRDMNKKLNKNVQFEMIGEDTEVDKTINDIITDPFMHMIRNSMDHAIESREDRIRLGKDPDGKIILSAQNIGGEIVIAITDDGRGLDAKGILAKARKAGKLTKADNEYTTKEIFQMIMLPGFSTNTQVTEYSGRGVGMDVVKRNIEKVNGTISIDSTPNKGTTFNIKIPLTLAIVDGLEFMVGKTIFTLPITSIRQTFRIETTTDCQIFYDASGIERMKLRNEVFPIIRLSETFHLPNSIQSFNDGIFILIENQELGACIFVDEIVGEQQVVVKPFPPFLSRYHIKDEGLAGCTILGDGNISLILDANGLLSKY